MIHEPRQLPLTTSTGHTVRPGTHTKIAIRQEIFNRQPNPYPSNCTSKWDKEYIELAKYPYSRQLCESFCIDDFLITFCNCTLLPVQELRNNFRPACNLGDLEVSGCILNASTVFFTHTEYLCPCEPACEEYNYPATISQGNWPSSYGWGTVAEQYKLKFLNETITNQMVMDAFAGKSPKIFSTELVP